MASTRQTAKGKIVCEYLTKHPDTPTATLAQLIYSDHPTFFTNKESVRTIIRSYRGEMKHTNVKQRFSRTPEQRKEALRSKLPSTDYDPVKPFKLPKGQNNILVLSDIHLPYHDETALQLAIDYGVENNVNAIYLNGDTMDMYQASRYTKDPRLRNLAGELEMTRNFLQLLQETFRCPIYFKIGNHEERWEHYLMLKAPELLGIDEFRLENLLRFREYGVTLVKSKQISYFGKLAVLHGHEFGHSVFSPVNPARGLYMRGKESCLAGHNHQTSEHSEKSLSGEVVTTFSTGALCGLSPDYMPFNKWNHGFAHVTVTDNGHFNVKNIRIINGKIV
jgi:predicted phosphodiesterase